MNIDIGPDAMKFILAVLSSTVLSGVINIIWNAHVRKQDIKRAQEEEKLKAGHVYLIVVDHLERFARECNERLSEIYEGLEEYRRYHQTDKLHTLPEIKFTFDPSLDWQVLPIPFVAELKSLAQKFDECNVWIRSEWNCGIDWDTAYEFEQERLAYYSLQVCKIIARTKTVIGVGSTDINPLTNRFNKLIQSKRRQYTENPGLYPSIPELQALFSDSPNVERG